jgi:N6-L-threonylcarbamoyladenine synthase
MHYWYDGVPMKNEGMNSILAIETSCDETAFSVLRNTDILSHQVHSQADMHAEFGGVFPMLAKREHDRNFIPLLALTLREAFGISVSIDDKGDNHNLDQEMIKKIESLLARENDLAADLVGFFNQMPHEVFIKLKSSLSAIAVTYGPGLEPALWVGISGAKALATIFDVPLYPINHMEGHIASVLASTAGILATPAITFPAIALLISGGHTELVHVESWHAYHLLGRTVDDAVGEAYDKVARLMDLPYPGGPQISRLAEIWRQEQVKAGSTAPQNPFALPRPMLHTKDYNFSFSGLKTAALYAVRDMVRSQHDEPLDQEQKNALSAEFEQAVVDTLMHKTKRAVEEYAAQSLIIGGGVIANQYIRQNFARLCDELGIAIFIPDKNLATDNATMIGLVAALQLADGKSGIMPNSAEFSELKANGNLSL